MSDQNPPPIQHEADLAAMPLADFLRLFGEQALELAVKKKQVEGLLQQVESLAACNADLTQELHRQQTIPTAAPPAPAEAASGDFVDYRDETD